MHEVKSEVAQSCLASSDPMDCNPPGSSVHGICQARVLEWVAIAFSIYVLVYCIGVFLLCITYVKSIINLLQYSTRKPVVLVGY